jgi:hypothetical protein
MLVALAGWAVMPSITAQAAATLPAGGEDPLPQLTGHKAAAVQLLSGKTAAAQLQSSKTATLQRLSSKAAAVQLLISNAAAANRLISKRAAAKQLSDNGSTAARLTDLRAEAGYRSVRLSWRLEPAPKRLQEEAANSFRIRYCENQVKIALLYIVQKHAAQYCECVLYSVLIKQIFLLFECLFLSNSFLTTLKLYLYKNVG